MRIKSHTTTVPVATRTPFSRALLGQAPLGWVCLLLAIVLSVVSGRALSAELPEYKVKAALLYKLSKFIEWPEQAFAGSDLPFTLCVFGDHHFGSSLDSLAVRTSVGGRSVSVRYLGTNFDASDACHMVFVSASEHYRLRGVLRELHRPYLVTVGDHAGFAAEGGMINLLTVDKKIRFEINRPAIGSAKVNISAQLLQLATLVE